MTDLQGSGRPTSKSPPEPGAPSAERAGPPLPPPSHLAPLPPARLATGVRIVSGVPFADLPGARPLELDLYLPDRPGPRPAVIFVHGGGWRLGSRRMAGPAYARRTPTLFEQVAAAGIAVASVDYRLSGEAVWPAQLHDVKAAVRWIRARAGELGVDPDRIAVWGESAGGHLAALIGLTGPEFDGSLGIVGPSTAVVAVAAWYAPSDLTRMPADQGADPASPDSREADLLGGPLSADWERTREASPISYVRADAPPFLLLHGTADTAVPYPQSERFRDALLAAGASVEFESFEGAEHMWLNAPQAPEWALARTIDFLVDRLAA